MIEQYTGLISVCWSQTNYVQLALDLGNLATALPPASSFPLHALRDQPLFSVLGNNMVLRLRSLAHPGTNDTSLQQTIAVLHKRCTNVQQLIRATFYLFVLLLFLGLQWAYVLLGDSRTPAAWLVIMILDVDCPFAA